ncbi:unnamed protein product, partial [Nesidiocoris tenuis]
SILYDPELRKLINQSNATFIASRNIPKGADPRKRLLELSREHRSCIRNCIENMQTRMHLGNTDVYNDWVDVLDNVDHIWHLCELLHLDVVPGAELRFPEYWNMVVGLLIEGRFEACRALLRLHSDAETPPYRDVEIILRTIPLFSVNSGISVPEFTARWRAWKSSIRSKIDSGKFASRPELLKIMKLLGSEEPLFSELKPHCSTWYHMLTASLLLTEQTVKIHDLTYHANQCITHYGGVPSLKLLDHTLLALLNSDLATVVKKLQLTADGGWCAVHLTNLLTLAGAFCSPHKSRGVDLDAMLLEYGQLLMSSLSFWQVGLTYLEYCANGNEAMRVSLIDLPLISNDVALRIISVAKDYGLDDVVKSVCRILCHKELKKGSFPGALTWTLVAEDSEMAGRVADQVLQSFARGCSEVELGCVKFIDNLGRSVLLNPRLTFLSKYCEFQTLYENKSWEAAAELLVRLIESKVSPKYFWLTLLSDAMPFLQRSSTPIPSLSHSQTMILLACLEELTMDVADNIVESFPNFNQKTHTLRIAIANNLGSALLKESSSTQPNFVTIECE